LKVRGDVVCGLCAESIFAKETIPADQVQQQIDPTICVGCGLDNGEADFVRLGQLPVCSACEALFRNRPFPNWIKAALVGMVILVISSLVWNSRFISAYYELKCFESAMKAGDLQRGAAYFISASRRVPENEEFQAYAALYEGILLLSQDKSAEALKLLESCRGRVAEESDLDVLIMNAQVGVAFNRGDYDEFLRLAQQMSEIHKDDPTYAGQLASAYACKYAETQDEQYKAKSLMALERARTLASANPADEQYHAEYAQRILHRLHTRQIIKRDEFYKRYPNGWTKEGEQTP
jgi:tetratricopeptide (TPR) repeat protein